VRPARDRTNADDSSHAIDQVRRNLYAGSNSDDHAVFRRGLKETLAEAFPKVTFGKQARHKRRSIMHAARIGMWPSWISACPEKWPRHLDDLKRLRPRLPILLLSMHPEQQLRAEHSSRSCGLLDKRRCAGRTQRSIKKIVGGGRLCECDARREARRGIEG